ncbi:MAG TPA: hypothetical protein VFU41_15695 [Gemmatimonadales bacterium]|nr:hypothetical protein [Gemmatimonadales bacterium]
MHPPRVLIASADQRSRTLLRAELRELGYDAIGASSLASGLRHPAVEGDRGPVRLVIADDRTAAVPALLERARAQYAGSRFLLIQRGAGAPPPGSWDKVLRRPVTIGEIVAAVRELAPLPPELRGPIDR